MADEEPPRREQLGCVAPNPTSITHWDSAPEATTASEAASNWAEDQSFIKGQTALHVGEEILTAT